MSHACRKSHEVAEVASPEQPLQVPGSYKHFFLKNGWLAGRRGRTPSRASDLSVYTRRNGRKKLGDKPVRFLEHTTGVHHGTQQQQAAKAKTKPKRKQATYKNRSDVVSTSYGTCCLPTYLWTSMS